MVTAGALTGCTHRSLPTLRQTASRPKFSLCSWARPRSWAPLELPSLPEQPACFTCPSPSPESRTSTRSQKNLQNDTFQPILRYSIQYVCLISATSTTDPGLCSPPGEPPTVREPPGQLCWQFPRDQVRPAEAQSQVKELYSPTSPTSEPGTGNQGKCSCQLHTCQSPGTLPLGLPRPQGTSTPAHLLCLCQLSVLPASFLIFPGWSSQPHILSDTSMPLLTATRVTHVTHSPRTDPRSGLSSDRISTLSGYSVPYIGARFM